MVSEVDVVESTKEYVGMEMMIAVKRTFSCSKLKIFWRFSRSLCTDLSQYTVEYMEYLK